MPRLIPALVRRAERLALAEVWLMDIDGEKLARVGALCQHLANQHGARFRLYLTTSADDAIRGADHIITAIRPGLEAGRAVDERLCFQHGVLGQETTGAAGFAMAMRSLPTILHYCRLAERTAPSAWIYNFTNPAGLVVQGLQQAGVRRVIGICDSANGAQHAISSYYRVPREAVRHEVFGLNHLSWTRSARLITDAAGQRADHADGEISEEGEEVLPALLADPAFVSGTHLGMFDPDLRQSLGMFLNEYLHYFYHRDEALAVLLAKPETRGEQVLRLTTTLLNRLQAANVAQDPAVGMAIYAEIMGQREATYMAHARHDAPRPGMGQADDDDEGYAGVALGCIEAIHHNHLHFTALNVPNVGAIAGFRHDDVVEVSCWVDASGPRPILIGTVPDAQAALMTAVKCYERLAATAILERSRRLAYDALTAHPLVGSYPLAKRLVEGFLAAHRQLVGEWL